MRDPNRIKEICDRLAVAWGKYPDLRLGQLLSNTEDVYRIENDTFYFPLFYIEDEEMISYIEKFIDQI